MPDVPESTDSLKAFGAVVKAFRERAGLTQEQLAPLVRYSNQTVASIEQGRRLPPKDFIDRAEEALDAFGTLRAAAKYLSRQQGLASWFLRWAEEEKTALSLNVYECRVLPGLLQTEAYMRAVILSVPPLASAEVVEQRVAARLARQQLLHRQPSVTFSFIIEQALLERHTGGIEVTREVVGSLLDCAELCNVDIQIMPLHQPDHAGHDGPLQLLETPGHEWFGYTEGNRHNLLISDLGTVSAMQQRYAKMRSQALTPEDSVSLLKRMREAL
ncbi:helix-turn-helix domain-containing protein [Streptomyces sp. NBC_01262]|uniref:helix-turn-helix domain-containing protein n=1 Tax=Streptomyces sp. NBC_01262 TaxID=2903803 RepID=UPI002E363A94|nr:helix-turn-helix transcriptional regulator [Streptomyces sp. NBC_01262]